VAKYHRSIFCRVAAAVFCTVVCGCYGYFAHFFETFIQATTEVTSVGKYERVLENYWRNEYLDDLVSPFPKVIPAEATHVRFSFLPGFLQGGAHIQLRYRTSPKKRATLCDFLRQENKIVFRRREDGAHELQGRDADYVFLYE